MTEERKPRVDIYKLLAQHCVCGNKAGTNDDCERCQLIAELSELTRRRKKPAAEGAPEGTRPADAQVAESDLRQRIDYWRVEATVTYAEMIGVLEVLKLEMYQELKGDEDE